MRVMNCSRREFLQQAFLAGSVLSFRPTALYASALKTPVSDGKVRALQN